MRSTSSKAQELTLAPDVHRALEGQTTLQRDRYFNISGGGRGDFSSDVPLGDANYLLNQLHISFGRNLGLVAYATDFGNITEDLKRPGFADPASVRAYFGVIPPANPIIKARFGDNLGIMMHEQPNAFPAFMGSFLTDDGKGRFPTRIEAAADYVAMCLKYGYDDFDRPRYYEIMNEPGWDILNEPMFRQLNAATKRAVEREGLDVLIGGPCKSVPYYFKNSYKGEWSAGMVPFINSVGQDVDFLSFHIYDYYESRDKKEISTGLPLESVFDLLADVNLPRRGNI